jgi:thioredoxin-dependent peroxiredoxin
MDMAETTKLAPGDQAPGFTLPDADGKPVSLSDYRG